MGKKLYSLEAINSNNLKDRVVIKVKNTTGTHVEKTYLANIDMHITTYFKSKKQFLYYLQSKGIISSKHDDIKITYKNRGINAMELSFDNENILNKVSKNSKSKIDVDSCKPEFNYVFNTFLGLCKKNEFFDMINKSNQIPNHLKQRANEINKFIDCGNIEDSNKIIEIKKSIEKELINYKVFRTVYMYISGYMNKIEVLNSTKLPTSNEEDKKNKKDIDGQMTLNDIDYDRHEKEEFLTDEDFERQL